MTTLALAEVRFRQFLAVAKPRVVSPIVFVAMIGIFLAAPGQPPAVPFVDVCPTTLAETIKWLGP
ncbi:MAG TPA: hypothetical protein VET86_09695, partial [Casimicrobiaceae bacterium]|nr:hypothetical protein [Casimicrobiaceae bacterium]